MTALVYNPVYDRPETDVVAGIRHNRVAHNGTQTQLAAYLSGYNNVPGGVGGCKHYIPYRMIQDAVETAVGNQGSLANVVNWLNNLNTPAGQTFTAANLGLGGNWSVNVGDIPDIDIDPSHTQHGVDYFSEAELNREIDDLIFNLANDPRNLFYRPNSSGDNGGTAIDNPTGAGPMPVGHLRGRLQAYRTALQNLGLNV